MATTHPQQVQTYLDKHKISSLFEDLMSKLVKELPHDPIDFLIGKLQIVLRQRKKATAAAGTPTSRTKIQVTGSAIPTKPAASKPASAERLTKSTGIARPLTTPPASRGKSPLTSSTPGATKRKAPPTPGASSIPKPSHPSKSSPARPAAVTTPTRPTSKTLAGRSKPVTTAAVETRRPTTAPPASRIATPRPGSAKTGRLAAAAVSRTTNLRKPGTSAGKVREKVDPKPHRKEDQPKKTPPTAPPTTAEELGEFFGEAKKSSTRQFVAQEEEEENGTWADVSSDEEEKQGVGEQGGRGEAVLDLEELMKARLSSKHKRSRRAQRCQHLHALLPAPGATSATPNSSGYISDDESEGGESDVVLVEDYSALEEEGVTGLTKGKYSRREGAPSEGAVVDLKVLLCARCARVLSQGEGEGEGEETEVSVTQVTQVTQSGTVTEGEFESASQVGSHTPFPQWEAGSAVGSELSSVQKWAGSQLSTSVRSLDAGSDVTQQSHDTWKGLIPQPRPPVPPSDDDESEVQLPPPPPMEGKPWVQEPHPQHDPHGWDREDHTDVKDMGCSAPIGTSIL